MREWVESGGYLDYIIDGKEVAYLANITRLGIVELWWLGPGPDGDWFKAAILNDLDFAKRVVEENA